MKMSQVVDGLRGDVLALGELGDDAIADAAGRIAGVLTRTAPGWILDVLSEAAADLSAELPEGRAEIRVTGDDIGLAYVGDEPATPSAERGEGDGDATARITLRLPERLKARIERSATADGISVNTYILRTLERGTAKHSAVSTGRGGTRIRGYGHT